MSQITMGNSMQDIKRQTYWWVLGLYEGRRVILGPYNEEAMAEQDAYSKLPGYYEVIPLNTKNVDAARKILRYRVIDQTQDISEASNRFKWKI